jgi:hypothetical protein
MAGDVRLLTEPYGFGNGDHIRLSSNDPVDDVSLEATLLGYSCYKPAIPKIKNCLRYSNLYECVVQSGWFRRQEENLRQDLQEIGVTLTILGRGRF